MSARGSERSAGRRRAAGEQSGDVGEECGRTPCVGSRRPGERPTETASCSGRCARSDAGRTWREKPRQTLTPVCARKGHLAGPTFLFTQTPGSQRPPPAGDPGPRGPEGAVGPGGHWAAAQEARCPRAVGAGPGGRLQSLLRVSSRGGHRQDAAAPWRNASPLLRVVFLSTSHGCPLKPARRHRLKCPHLTGGDIAGQKGLCKAHSWEVSWAWGQAPPLINCLQGRLPLDLRPEEAAP